MSLILEPDVPKILSCWNLKADHWQKVKDVYKVKTNQGIKNLKVSPLIPGRLIFVTQAIAHLEKNGFRKFYPLIKTADGRSYVTDQHFAYTLFDWIEGRQCDIKNYPELLGSTRILAEFHQKSLGFTPPDHSNMRNRLGKCLNHFEERLQDLRFFKEKARLIPDDPFAALYVKNVDYFIPMAVEAIVKLKNSSYPELVQKAYLSRPFCHGDPAARNFILTPEQKIFLIDFDSCRVDLPIMDLIKFSRRVLKKYRWRPETAKRLMDAYQEIHPLTANELEVMKAVFYFPQKFWRIACRYFNQYPQCNQRRDLAKFQKVTRARNELARFQADFDQYQI
ncbi:MAG: CotS family spore coat protein [Firmicutes bacterium]|nr:CotS family spore coat protein [Bacillota bacterium]